MLDMQALHHPPHHGHVLFFGLSQQTEAAAAAQQDHFLGGVDGRRRFGLGHVGHGLPQLPVGDAADVPALKTTHTLFPFQQAHDAAQKRGLARAVGAQNGQQLSFVQLEADIL